MTSDAEAAREDVRGKFHLPVKCIFREPMESVPFEVVVEELYGFKVRKFDPEADGKLLERIENAMRDACLFARKGPIKRNRPNEVGNDMEPFVVKALKSHGMAAAAPKTRSGRGRSAGYPDVKMDIDPVPIFLEVKTYSASTRRSSQRSVFLSPSKGQDSKVTEDGYHLLVGFEMERTGTLYRPVAFQLVDLHGLEFNMKAEFNANNRSLYDHDGMLAAERV